MTKVLVEQRFVSATSADRRNFLVKPKVHIMKKRRRMNWSLKNRNNFKQKKKNFQNYLQYYRSKKLSVVVHCIALVILSTMIAVETENFSKHPTITSVEDEMYPVQKIDFPGVAICNINVISHEQATNFAQTLWMDEKVRNIANLTVQEVEKLLKYMGRLYEFEYRKKNSGRILLLHSILEKAFGEDYDVLRIMKRLTPKCRTFFSDCSWQGDVRRCDELFVPRWTSEGFCCTFNHVTWTNHFSGDQDAGFKINVERSTTAGSRYGLNAILNPDLDDYYWPIGFGRGFRVLIYSSSDYPDIPSGGVRAVMLNPGTESFLTMKATLFYTSPDVIKFEKQKRKCLFKTELSEIYGGSYSYSQCMMFCRVNIIRKSCSCNPFFYPLVNDVGQRMCTVKDLVCLQKNKYKWWSIEPTENAFSLFSSDNSTHESSTTQLQCDCWPSCEHIEYTVTKTSSKLHPSSLLAMGDSPKNLTLDSVMTLSVVFAGIGMIRLKQDVMFYWYELMSNYGGLCSLFLGISIVTPIEFLYLLCLRVWQRKTRSEGKSQSQVRIFTLTHVKIKTHDQPIYWREIMSQKRLDLK